MSEIKCPKCGSDTRCLAGESAHPNNWYCKDEDGCGWQAWSTDTQSISDLVAEIKEYIKNKESWASSHNTMNSESFGYLKRCLTELEQVEPVIRVKVIGECVERISNDKCDGESNYASGVNAACERHVVMLENMK